MTTRFDSDGNEIQDAGSLAYADDLEDGIVEEPPRTSRKPAIALTKGPKAKAKAKARAKKKR